MHKIKKALIVDDSKLARLTLERLLEHRGIEVVEADSVDSGLAVLRSEEHVNAIFLDVQMPEKNGFDGLKLIKADPALRDIPCSMYSGDLSVDAQQEAISGGAQAYLFKPANHESLEHVLQALAANVVAEDMQQYTETEATTLPNDETTKSVKKHKHALMTLDGRTRSLARLLNKEKEQTGSAVSHISEKLTQVTQELDSLKKQTEHSQHDDLLHKRAENDIRGQLQKTRDNLRLATTIAIVASIAALFALIISAGIYFYYLKK